MSKIIFETLHFINQEKKEQTVYYTRIQNFSYHFLGDFHRQFKIKA